MAASTPLKGAELIDCARANGSFGIEVAAQRSGYDDIDQFQQALKQACDSIGVEFHSFDALVKLSESGPDQGVIIAPDTSSQL
jgi:hypothetical protein